MTAACLVVQQIRVAPCCRTCNNRFACVLHSKVSAQSESWSPGSLFLRNWPNVQSCARWAGRSWPGGGDTLACPRPIHERDKTTMLIAGEYFIMGLGGRSTREIPTNHASLCTTSRLGPDVEADCWTGACLSDGPGCIIPGPPLHRIARVARLQLQWHPISTV